MRWVVGIDRDFGEELIRKVTPSAFALYFILRGYANTENRCYPSVPTLAKKLGKDERTVFRNLDELEEAQVLKRVKHEGKPNTYVLIETISIQESEPLTETSPLTKIAQPLTNLSPTPDILVSKTPDKNGIRSIIQDEVKPNKKDDVIASAKQNALTALIAKFTDALKTTFTNNSALFSDVNLQEQIREVTVWVQKKPGAAKKKRDLNRFSLNWLNTAQERAQYKQYKTAKGWREIALSEEDPDALLRKTEKELAERDRIDEELKKLEKGDV